MTSKRQRSRDAFFSSVSRGRNEKSDNLEFKFKRKRDSQNIFGEVGWQKNWGGGAGGTGPARVGNTATLLNPIHSGEWSCVSRELKTHSRSAVWARVAESCVGSY